MKSLWNFYDIVNTPGDEGEAKFMALKSLHMKKLKHLMASIDSKDKEISKLKILNKVFCSDIDTAWA